MRRLTAGAALLLLTACSATRGPDRLDACRSCAYGPHAEAVKHTVYTTTEEHFCLERVSLHHAGPCCGECLPRTKTRLVKWEVPGERVAMKCAVEPAPGSTGRTDSEK